MPAPKRLTARYSRTFSIRGFSTAPGRLTAPQQQQQQRRVIQRDDIHRPSLSGSSVGHLISEISQMRPGMEGLRPEGQTMSEDQRRFARRIVTWLMGVPLLLGTALVGGKWIVGTPSSSPSSPTDAR